MLKKVVKSFYAHNSNYNEQENTVLKYMDENDFDELMEFITDKYGTYNYKRLAGK